MVQNHTSEPELCQSDCIKYTVVMRMSIMYCSLTCNLMSLCYINWCIELKGYAVKSCSPNIFWNFFSLSHNALCCVDGVLQHCDIPNMATRFWNHTQLSVGTEVYHLKKNVKYFLSHMVISDLSIKLGWLMGQFYFKLSKWRENRSVQVINGIKTFSFNEVNIIKVQQKDHTTLGHSFNTLEPH